jgi:hypothetical protein
MNFSFSYQLVLSSKASPNLPVVHHGSTKTQPRQSIDWQLAQSSSQSALISANQYFATVRGPTMIRPGQIEHRVDDSVWADQLLTLVYYNVMRAMAANIQMLGLDIDFMCSDEYQSPFATRHWEPSELASIPWNFRPTYIQATIPHHPQWDIFPDPVLRDNVLLYGEENVDDANLCLDIVGDSLFSPLDDSPSQTGMIVWGEPHDIMSWEVTEGFAAKYAWFLVGANILQISTNEWRRKRDKSPLSFR